MPDLWVNLFPDVWRFQSRLIGPPHPVNGYLLRRTGESWLVDPPADLTPAALAERIGSDAVTRIFITHWQAEHVAGIMNFPTAKVHASPGDAWLARGTVAVRSAIGPWPEPWEWETRGNYPGHLAGSENERPLDDPVTLHADWPEEMKMFPTPGHGKNAVTWILCVEDGAIGFCGDLIYGDGQLWNWFDCDWDYGPETGQRTLRDSAQRLAESPLFALLPAHGPMISEPSSALGKLARRIDRVLIPSTRTPGTALNRPEVVLGETGFRQLAPHLYQSRTGNTAVITSDSGRAIVVDDGLCIWEPLEVRAARHDQVFQTLKAELKITQIDWIIPTHYHGDHIDGIARLALAEGARVIALESISGPLENPEAYHLACALPWYGTGQTHLKVDFKVADEFCLHWEGRKLQFFRLGGQTWHHQGIQVDLDGLNVLLVGDAWWGTSSEPNQVLCWNEAEPESQGWVFALDRMIERSADLLVCGHASAIFDPQSLLIEAREKWRLHLADFRELNPHASASLFFNPFFRQPLKQSDKAVTRLRSLRPCST